MRTSYILILFYSSSYDVVGIGLLAGAVASVGSIILSPAIAVFVMAGVAIAHAPYAAYKEARIIKLPGKY